MKKVYLTILSIITVICIIAGIVVNVGGTKMWALYQDNKVHPKAAVEADFTDTVDAFAAIELGVAAAKLTIQKGDGYGIGYKGAEALRPDYSVSGNTLTVKSPSGKLNWTAELECRITITVPENVRLSAMNLEIDAGSVECTGISADKLEIDVDAGNVEVYDAVYGTIDAKVDAGNVYFKDCTFTEMEAAASMGNVELDHCAFDRVDAQADMGNVTIASSQDVSTYDIDLDTDMGNVNVNGKRQSTSYTVNGDKERYIRVDVSMGNADLIY